MVSHKTEKADGQTDAFILYFVINFLSFETDKTVLAVVAVCGAEQCWVLV